MNNKFKIAYVHIGSDKTGSTTLQYFMNSNREVNESNYGIYYAPEQWHARFASYFSGSKKDFIHNVHSELEDECQISKLDSAYMASLEFWFESLVSPQKLVFSYEGFHTLSSDNFSEMRQYLLKYAEEVRLIYYVRPPISYSISSFSQHIKMGLKVDTLAPVLPYTSLIKNFINVFSKDEIYLKKYSKDELYKNDIIADFMHLVGGNYNKNIYIDEQLSENQSLCDLACFVGKKAIEKYFSSEKGKSSSSFDLGRKLLPFLMGMQGDKLKLTPIQLRSVLDSSRESSRYIEVEFDIDLYENPSKYVYTDLEMSIINSRLFQNSIDNLAEHILSVVAFPEAKLS